MKRSTRFAALWSLVFLFLGGQSGRSQTDDLDARFAEPVEGSKPWCYWYWLGGDITAEGLTRDLESMARVGIRKAFTAIIGGRPRKGRPHIEILADEWMELFRHALREAPETAVGPDRRAGK